jgi:hypothetical protein
LTTLSVWISLAIGLLRKSTGATFSFAIVLQFGVYATTGGPSFDVPYAVSIPLAAIGAGSAYWAIRRAGNEEAS